MQTAHRWHPAQRQVTSYHPNPKPRTNANHMQSLFRTLSMAAMALAPSDPRRLFARLRDAIDLSPTKATSMSRSPRENTRADLQDSTATASSWVCCPPRLQPMIASSLSPVKWHNRRTSLAERVQRAKQTLDSTQTWSGKL